MRCEGCALEDAALKTVRWRTGHRRFVLCDGCYPPLSGLVWVVAGDFSVVSRCDSCEAYLNPRELVPGTSRSGGHGKRDVVSTGLCRSCARR